MVTVSVKKWYAKVRHSWCRRSGVQKAAMLAFTPCDSCFTLSACNARQGVAKTA